MAEELHKVSVVNLEERVEFLLKLIEEKERRSIERAALLKELFEAKLAAQEKATGIAFTAAEKAVDKAEASQKAYNERSNEFRGQLDDQAKGFIPRAEADSRDERTRESVEAAKKESSLLRDEINSRIGLLENRSLTRESYEKQYESLIDRISRVERTIWMLAGAIGLVTLILPVLLHFWK